MENENFTMEDNGELLIIEEQKEDNQEAAQDNKEDTEIDYKELLKTFIEQTTEKKEEIEEVTESTAQVPESTPDPDQVTEQTENIEEEVDGIEEDVEVETIDYSQLVYELLQEENGQNKLDTAIDDISLTNTLLIILFVLGLAQLALHIGRGLL